MELLDRKFKNNKLKYILQSLLATAAVFVVLLILDALTNAAIIAALGASSFIAFTMPHAQVSRPRFLVGGYLVGIASGSLCYFLSTLPALALPPLLQPFPDAIFGSAAVGLAFFVMVITNTEHPPAAGIALGLVLEGLTLPTVAVVLIGIISLSVLRALLKPLLIDLL